MMAKNYTLCLAFLFAFSIADICVSACTIDIGPLAQLISQLVIQFFTSIVICGLYMRTVLIALPPSATGTFLWSFLCLYLLRLTSLIIVRVLAFKQATGDINIVFDAFNAIYWWAIFAAALELGKAKYYSFRYAFT
jgi:hypothetical protein